MSICTYCIHLNACQSWIRHGNTLYDDFAYSVGNCPYFKDGRNLAEVIHAHWEDGYAMHNGKEVYKSIDCSVCNEVFKIESHDREYWKNRFKNCPFCGAMMEAPGK